MMELVSPNILIIFTLLVGLLNLIIPFIKKEDTTIRTFLLTTLSIIFFINVLIIDWLFLHGISAELELFHIDKYAIAFHLEPIGLIFLNLISILWIFALMYTIKFLAVNQMENSSRFLLFANLSIMIGVTIALAANLITLFIGYELLTLSTIPLIAHKDGENVSKGLFNYLKILLLSGLILFLPAVIIIYVTVGHGNFTSGGFIAGHFSDNMATILLLMFVFGVSKAAVYPLHKWLPSAMVASYPVSALLHAVVVVKTGLFCIYKILAYVFGLNFLHNLFLDYNWLILLPAFTIIYSSMQALKYSQIKMVLAYSTINQLSIALISAFLLTPKGLIAAIMHMVSHSFTKICIFYSAGNMYSVKNSYKVVELIGIRDVMPKTSFILLIAGLSLMGIPPFAGFISKFYIMLAAAEEENLVGMITLGISTLFSAIYMIRMLIFVYRPVNKKFNSHVKLKSQFYELNENGKINYRKMPKAELKLPSLMIYSLAFCLLGVIFFLPLQQVIQQFLIYL